MFSPAFAPFANPEAIVNSKLALAMLNAGWQVDVIARNYVGTSDYDYGSSWVEPWLPLKIHTHEIQYEVGNNIKRLYDTFLSAGAMGFPIDGCRWARRAYDMGMKLNDKYHYNVILSRALPDFAHLPAMKMAVKTGTPWVANWNDPWNFLRLNNAKCSLMKNIGFIKCMYTRRVAKRVSWHTFPGYKLRKIMCSYLNSNAFLKSSIIPHAAMPFKISDAEKNNSIFKIGYIGRLSKYHEPMNFFEGLKLFIKSSGLENRVSFNFIGADEIGIKEIFNKIDMPCEPHIVGKLAYIDSLKYASTFDVLLIIDPPESKGIIMMSKIVDYVQTGKPILAIATADSTTSSIINNGGGIVADCTSLVEISNSLSTLYASWRVGNLDEKYGSTGLYKLFAPDSILSLYQSVFDTICPEEKRN